jgi:hypothetical protein
MNIHEGVVEEFADSTQFSTFWPAYLKIYMVSGSPWESDAKPNSTLRQDISTMACPIVTKSQGLLVV